MFRCDETATKRSLGAVPGRCRRCTARLSIKISTRFTGLSAALMLRRHRLSVTVLDAGPPRNAWASEVHAYLGAERLSGTEMRQLGRRQVEQAGAPARASSRIERHAPSTKEARRQAGGPL